MSSLITPQFLIFLFSQIVPLIIIGGAISYFLYDRYIRRYIRINIVRNIEGKWFLIHSKKLGMKKQTYVMKHKDGDKTYTIAFPTAIIDQRNRPIIYYDLDNTNPIGFSIFEKTYKYNPTNLTRVLRSHLVSEFLGSSKEKMFIILVIALIIGIVGIAIYSQYQLNLMNDKLVKLLQEQIPPDIVIGG